MAGRHSSLRQPRCFLLLSPRLESDIQRTQSQHIISIIRSGLETIIAKLTPNKPENYTAGCEHSSTYSGGGGDRAISRLQQIPHLVKIRYCGVVVHIQFVELGARACITLMINLQPPACARTHRLGSRNITIHKDSANNEEGRDTESGTVVYRRLV